MALHQTGVPGYGLVSSLMGDAHPTGFLVTLLRGVTFCPALRAISDMAEQSPALALPVSCLLAPVSCFLRIGGNHIFIFPLTFFREILLSVMKYIS
jgi:hypothetical protein